MKSSLNIILSFLIFCSFWPMEGFSYMGAGRYGVDVIGISIAGQNIPQLLVAGDNAKDEIDKLERLFFQLYGLPNLKDILWVNLRAGVGSRGLIGRWLGYTDVGRYLFESDLLLKEDGMRLVGNLLDEYGIDIGDRDVNLRFWITGGDVEVSKFLDGMVINKAWLKVHVDVVGADKDKRKNTLKRLLEKSVLPVLEQKVNEDIRYSLLRQIYRLYIVCRWLEGRQGYGNWLIKRLAYYYGGVGEKRWRLWDVVNRYLSMYLGKDGEFGDVVGGVYLGRIGKFIEKARDGSIAGLKCGWGKVAKFSKKNLFGGKFVIFGISLIFMFLTSFGSVAWAKSSLSDSLSSVVLSAAETKFFNRKRDMKEFFSNILTSKEQGNHIKTVGHGAEVNKMDIYDIFSKEFSVEVKIGKDGVVSDVIVSDVIKGALLCLNPIYGDLFNLILSKAESMSVLNLSSDDVYRLVRLFKLYPNQLHLFGKFIRDSDVYKELVKKDSKRETCRLIFDCFELLVRNTRINRVVPAVVKPMKFGKKRDVFDVSWILKDASSKAKGLFYYWVYTQGNGSSLLKRYQKEIEDIVSSRSLEELSPYEASIWFILRLEKFVFGFFLKNSNKIFTNIAKLTDRERIDFVNFVLFYFSAPERFDLSKHRIIKDLIRYLFHMDLEKYCERYGGPAVFYSRHKNDLTKTLEQDVDGKDVSVRNVDAFFSKWIQIIFDKMKQEPLFIPTCVNALNPLSRKIAISLLLQKKFGFRKEFWQAIDIYKPKVEFPMDVTPNLLTDKEFLDLILFLSLRENMYTNEFGAFNFENMLLLYQSLPFKEAFGDIKDKRLKFTILAGVMNQLFVSSNYIPKKGIVFSNEDIATAVKAVKHALELAKSRRILVKKNFYSMFFLAGFNFASPDDYERLLKPRNMGSVYYETFSSFSNAIRNTRGPLWIVINSHGIMTEDGKYSLLTYNNKGELSIYISPDEMARSLITYAEKNNWDLSKVVIVAGNCYPGFWVKVLDVLRKNNKIKDFPVIISGALVTSPQLGVSIYPLNFGKAFLDWCVWKAIKKKIKKWNGSITLYELFKHMADEDLPVLPMIVSMEKKKGNNVGLILLSLGFPFGFPFSASAMGKREAMDLFSLGREEIEENELRVLLYEFVRYVGKRMENTGYKSLFVGFLERYMDRLLELMRDKECELIDIADEDIKELIKEIELARVSGDNEEILDRLAGMLKSNVVKFLEIAKDEIFKAFDKTTSSSTKKGGIEFF